LSKDTKAQPTKDENMIELWLSRLCAPFERCRDAIKAPRRFKSINYGREPESPIICPQARYSLSRAWAGPIAPQIANRLRKK